jgi:hypothetical protein
VHPEFVTTCVHIVSASSQRAHAAMMCTESVRIDSIDSLLTHVQSVYPRGVLEGECKAYYKNAPSDVNRLLQQGTLFSLQRDDCRQRTLYCRRRFQCDVEHRAQPSPLTRTLYHNAHAVDSIDSNFVRRGSDFIACNKWSPAHMADVLVRGKSSTKPTDAKVAPYRRLDSATKHRIASILGHSK